MSLERAQCADLDAIRDLLVTSSLPTDDLDAAGPQTQWVWKEAGRVVGTIGADLVGSYAVIRSLAVMPTYRCGGIAAQLCREVELTARDAGVTEAYLLTESARGFFERLGYRAIPRTEVPPAVASHRQFASGCCACAVTLTKRLDQVVAPASQHD